MAPALAVLFILWFAPVLAALCEPRPACAPSNARILPVYKIHGRQSVRKAAIVFSCAKVLSRALQQSHTEGVCL
jgi:hypothetical protein